MNRGLSYVEVIISFVILISISTFVLQSYGDIHKIQDKSIEAMLQKNEIINLNNLLRVKKLDKEVLPENYKLVEDIATINLPQFKNYVKISGYSELFENKKIFYLENIASEDYFILLNNSETVIINLVNNMGNNIKFKNLAGGKVVINNIEIPRYYTVSLQYGRANPKVSITNIFERDSVD
ncbi:MAG: hypothetical protein ACK5LT_06570 [Lachnospirales bacterium]